MRNLLNFIIKYNNLIIFLILEGIAFFLLSTANNYHNSRIIKGVRGLTSGIERKVSNAKTYFHLREIGQDLARENIVLKNKIESLEKKKENLFFSVIDSVYGQQYVWSSAEVVNNSVNRQKNFLTLNKGSRQDLAIDMAVASGDGVVGVIVACSDNYSVAMSVLNIDFRLSSRIKSNGYFGSLSWDGRDISHAVLSEIPQHVSVNVGDTVETTGFSAVFPEGIMVGTISEFEKTGSDFYRISVLLRTDFKKLHFVNVIGNMRKTEQLELEKPFQ
jgi:rod shape-determining protein MreC